MVVDGVVSKHKCANACLEFHFSQSFIEANHSILCSTCFQSRNYVSPNGYCSPSKYISRKRPYYIYLQTSLDLKCIISNSKTWSYSTNLKSLIVENHTNDKITQIPNASLQKTEHDHTTQHRYIQSEDTKWRKLK